jgi:hypothetical protein
LQLLLLRLRHTSRSVSAVAATCYSIAVTWLHATCLHCYRGRSSAALAADRSTCHHYSSDSSCTTQWTSESGTASSLVFLTYRAGVLVVCFTRDRAGSALYSFSHGLYTNSVHFSASDGHPVSRSLGATFSELTGQPTPPEFKVLALP